MSLRVMLANVRKWRIMNSCMRVMSVIMIVCAEVVIDFMYGGDASKYAAVVIDHHPYYYNFHHTTTLRSPTAAQPLMIRVVT